MNTHQIQPGDSVDVAAAKALCGLIHFCDEHFSCTEAEAFVALIRREIGEDSADAFLAWHAEGDDEGDDHYTGAVTE